MTSSPPSLPHMQCVECGTPVQSVYKEFSKGNIRLTQCSVCHRFVDKYVEYEIILIFLDLILHKRTAYRHLRFNTDTVLLKRALLKLFPAYLFLDTYLKWSRLLNFYDGQTQHSYVHYLLSSQGQIAVLVLQLTDLIIYLLSICIIIPLVINYLPNIYNKYIIIDANGQQHQITTINEMTGQNTTNATLGTTNINNIHNNNDNSSSSNNNSNSNSNSNSNNNSSSSSSVSSLSGNHSGNNSVPSDHAHSSSSSHLSATNSPKLAMADEEELTKNHHTRKPSWRDILLTLSMSSFGKLFIVLLLIWDYELDFSRALTFFVCSSNITALSVYLNISMFNAGLFVLWGQLCRFGFFTLVSLYDPFINPLPLWI